jgi:catechol 2,3-dioxygenase-like lactoylglutathione lyase family enzyme
MDVLGVLETSLYVGDLAAAERFYAGVLGLTRHSRQAGRHVFFRCGRQMLLLFDPAASRHEGGELPPHGADGPGHAALAVAAADLDAWRLRLRERGVAIEREIDWPGGGRSLYFRDPAGNSLELATPSLWGIGEEPG